MNNNRIFLDELPQIHYFKIPTELVLNKQYKQLSLTAKLLYGLMLNRTSLSNKNKWINDKNEVYIYYSINNMMLDLNVSRNTVRKCIEDLKQYNLVDAEEVKHGKPVRYYLKRIKITPTEDYIDNDDNVEEVEIDLKDLVSIDLKRKS